MVSLALIAVTAFILPAYICIAIFRYRFPKHTLKLSDAQQVPIGIAYCALANSILFPFAQSMLVPYFCQGDQSIGGGYLLLFGDNYWKFLLLVLACLALPVIFGWFAIIWIYHSWGIYLDVRFSREPMPNRNSIQWLRYKIGHAIEVLLLNYMGQITIHDKAKHILMVDVLSDDDSLYSGQYSEYFFEDGVMTGLKLESVVRFSLKNESERKRARNLLAVNQSPAADPTSLQQQAKNLEEIPYILPNLGSMIFPIKNIRNYHFWTIKRDAIFVHDFRKPIEQVRAIWHLVIKKNNPGFGIRVVADFPKSDDLNLSNFAKEINKLDISTEGLDSRIEGQFFPASGESILNLK